VFIVVSVYLVIDSVRKLLDTSSYCLHRSAFVANFSHMIGPLHELNLIKLAQK